MDILKFGVIGVYVVKFVVLDLRWGCVYVCFFFMVVFFVVWIIWKKYYVYRNIVLVMFNRIKLIELFMRCFFMNLFYVIVNLVFGLYLLFYYNWFEKYFLNCIYVIYW